MSTEGGWPAGVDRIVLAEVDSTNAEAARRAPGLKRPAWIMALRQTAARGRRGRAWASPEGNFAATLVMRPAGDAGQAALRSFVAALALADTLSALTGGQGRIDLKWPNDVLLNGGKVAGILLESSGAGQRIAHLAIGIGINLVAAPPPGALEPGALPAVSVLGETGVRLAPETVLDRLAGDFARWEGVFAAEGFAAVREAWLARAARLGQPITARTMSETITGIFSTVGPDGALVLTDQAGGWRSLPAADVYF